MDKSKIGFSINRYDEDGDEWEKGIYIHLDDHVTINIGEGMVAFDGFVNEIINMRKEIEENLQREREDDGQG